ALEQRDPVIPVAIVGAEEANINLKELHVHGFRVPLPLNILPLPSKWHIRILPPVKWSVDPTFMLDPSDPRNRVLAHRVRKNIMHEIHKMVKERGDAFR